MNGRPEFTRTLQRQLKKVYGETLPDDPKLMQLLDMVSQAYTHYEEDRAMLERSSELSAQELNDANARLKAEADAQRVLLSILQDAIAVLDATAENTAHSTGVIDASELVRQADLLRKTAEHQKKIEAELRAQEARMAEAQYLANFGNWAYEFKSGVVNWSPQMWVIYGRNPELPPLDAAGHTEACHPDDRAVVDARLLELKHKPVVSMQFRIIRPDGSVRWLDSNIKIIRRPEDGKGIGMVGTVIDITDRKQAEISLAEKVKEVQETSNFLDTLIDNLPVMLFVKDADTLRYIRFNKKACEMTGYSAEQVLGKNAQDLFPPDQARIYNRQDIEVLSSGEMVVERDEPLLMPDGSKRLLHTRKVPIYGTDGHIRFLMTISEDITDQRLAEEKMRSAAQAADEANRAKSAFLSSMSHELRTPLNAIIGFAQILQRDTSIPAQQRGYVETMYRSGNHLLDMINDVLDLSKIEAGKFELVFEPFDLHVLVADVEALFRLKAAEKRITFTTAINSNVPKQVTGDAKRISQILINLVGNAIKFTDEGSVHLSVEAEHIPSTSSMMIRFNVKDTGRGIPEDQQTLIFEPFRQVRGFYSEGTGLGLAICSRLAGILDGSMGVESEVGKGSKFWLEIPLETAALPETSHEEKYVPVTGIEDNRKWRILIADDIPSNRAVVRALLESVGFEIVEAANGADAVQMAELFRPDVIFMDIMMPVMDGVEATHRIRLHHWGNAIKIIALTASGSSDRRKELVNDGFDEYIPKPFKEQWIFAALERYAGIKFRREVDTGVSGNKEEKVSMENVMKFVRSLSQDERGSLAEAAEMLDFQKVLKIVHPHVVQHETAREIARNATSQNNLFFLNLTDMITE